ncbi:MAG: hypothetical protein ABI408_06030 [Gemmatimonadaceae bacterium]
MTVHQFKPLLGFLLGSTIAGCSSDMIGANLHPVKLSFTTNVSSAALSSGAALKSDLAVGPAGDLVLTKVQLVLDKIELNEGMSTSCVTEIEDSGNDHGAAGVECEDVARDPVLVDMPLDATLKPTINVPLSAGTYSKLEAKLEPARDGATAFNAANPTFAGKSVRVEGTFKGTPFVFTSAVRAGIEMGFDPPLVIDAVTTNATISINVAKWFLDANNAAVDPSTATVGSDALARIEDNIRRSFHAFEDDHESGVDDHAGHSGND